MVVIEITLVNAFGEKSYSQNVIVNSPNEPPPAKEEVQTAPDPAPDHSEDPETTPGAKESLAESQNQQTQSNKVS